MIRPAQCDQIMRLARAYFDGSDQAARAWLKKNYSECVGGDPRQLAGARRAGQVIAVLKQMHARRKAS